MAKDLVTIILLSGTIFTLGCISISVIAYFYAGGKCNMNLREACTDIEMPHITFYVTSQPAEQLAITEMTSPPIELDASCNNILCLEPVDVSESVRIDVNESS